MMSAWHLRKLLSARHWGFVAWLCGFAFLDQFGQGVKRPAPWLRADRQSHRFLSRPRPADE
jgi:hypothetical protein